MRRRDPDIDGPRGGLGLLIALVIGAAVGVSVDRLWIRGAGGPGGAPEVAPPAPSHRRRRPPIPSRRGPRCSVA